MIKLFFTVGTDWNGRSYETPLYPYGAHQDAQSLYDAIVSGAIRESQFIPVAPRYASMKAASVQLRQVSLISLEDVKE